MTLKRIATGAMTGTLGTLLLASSAFAATTVTVSNNGNNSNNSVGVNNVSGCNVVQGNILVVGTRVKSKAKTGGNSANGNNGGAVSVTTGSATSTNTVSVTAGGNLISTQPCCNCAEPTTTVSVTDNGNGSTNAVGVNNMSSKNVIQFNGALVLTGVSASAKTGGNTANGNNGAGPVSITSGPATSSSTVTVTTGANSM